MVKVWADVAWADYCQFFELHKHKLVRMTHDLLKDIERNGVDKGRGQPEPLKYELKGYWSRRIDLANRLVYKVDGDKLYIVQCGTHYHQEK
jgi:toxin YoeB